MRDQDPTPNGQRRPAANLWAVVAVGFALLILLIAAFAAGPVAVFMISERSAASESTVGPTVPTDHATALTDSQLERLALEVRSQYVDDRAESINWWLMAAAVALAFITVFTTGLGIIIVIAGFVGYRWFRDILDDARRYTAEAQRSALQAQTVADGAQTTASEAERLAAESEEIVERIRRTEEQANHAVERLSISTAQDAATSNDLQWLADLVSGLIQATDIDRATADALRLQRQGDTKAAIEKWRSIANIIEGIDDKRAARAWFSVGYLQGDEGEHELAVAAYDRAIRLDPTMADAHNDRGNAKSRLGRNAEAISDYDTAILIAPEYALAYSNRGNAKRLLGQLEQAKGDLDTAIRLDPRHAPAYNNRGITQSMLGRHEDAINDYDKAIQLDPGLSEALNNRGASKHALRQHEDAIDDFASAIRVDPNYATAYNNRGNANLAVSLLDAAVADYTVAIGLNPEYARAYSNRGAAKFHLGLLNQAKDDFVECIRLDPQFAEAYANLGEVEIELGEYHNAIVSCNKALDLNPSLGEVYYHRGMAQMALSSISEARTDFEMAAKLADQESVSELKQKVEQALAGLDGPD